MEEQKLNSKKRIIQIIIFASIISIVLFGSYVFLSHFLKDRQTALGFDSPKRSPKESRTQTNIDLTNKTPEEIQEMRKTGQLPANAVPFQQNTAPQPNAHQDAIQRSLQTINEINKINEMNRRLMEQQQRR